MKKYIFALVLSSVIFGNDLFAQNPVEVKSMDMNEYAGWVGLGMIAMIFTMFALFLIFSSREENTEIALPNAPIIIPVKFAQAAGINSVILVPCINIEMNKIRILLISTVILFSLILLLLLIQK